MPLQFVLASSSVYRQKQLRTIGLPFSIDKPEIDETPFPEEPAKDLAVRLAEAKCTVVAARHPEGIIIASDQVAESPDGQILGKPGTLENATRQLRHFSGKTVNFHTALCVKDQSNNRSNCIIETFTVHFRQLSTNQIIQYLELEKPFDCAGSFKAEGLGVRLFSALQGRDHNTLIGLPIMALIDTLLNWGIDPLDYVTPNLKNL
ncbi:maf protein [Oleiphilus messinensis]|uniref:7-methyl-GTP pyrophosphatase n=1 Tax=Oleiphilus messinensis TaxID=141451 RepID=A0A1Y0I947_9GAMM|nr:Maf family protein [Oleiphilus messinensis]ARU56286.1 maf protein [Oleiphilus messinensis]